jgi:hypothetical protein
VQRARGECNDDGDGCAESRGACEDDGDVQSHKVSVTMMAMCRGGGDADVHCGMAGLPVGCGG